MNKYFVSYNFCHGNQMGFGHTETTLAKKITDINVIREVASSIEETFNYPKDSVIILNFEKFDE